MMASEGQYISKCPRKTNKLSKIEDCSPGNFFPGFLGRNIKDCPPSKLFLFIQALWNLRLQSITRYSSVVFVSVFGGLLFVVNSLFLLSFFFFLFVRDFTVIHACYYLFIFFILEVYSLSCQQILFVFKTYNMQKVCFITMNKRFCVLHTLTFQTCYSVCIRNRSCTHHRFA